MPELESTLAIDELFKGERSPVVTVTTNTNVLAYPGSTVTRYEMRWTFAEALLREQDDVIKQIDDARSSVGKVYPEPQLTDLGRRLGELIGAYNALQPQTISVDNGKLLWELGGVIRCGPSYLVALSPDRSGKYRVESWFDGTIWWGQEARDIAESLRELQKTTAVAALPSEGPLCIVCRGTN